jgi:hypothetical protein
MVERVLSRQAGLQETLPTEVAVESVHIALSEDLGKMSVLEPEAVMVCRTGSRLTVFKEDEQKLFHLGLGEKTALAYFAAMTRGMISRHIDPWIPKDELEQQVERHVLTSFMPMFRTGLRRLNMAGILETSPSLGHRLSCSLGQVLSVLKRPDFNQSLEVVGFDTWFGEEYPDWLLIRKTYIPLVQAVWQRCQAVTDDSDYLDRQVLANISGLTPVNITSQYRVLEEIGLITRDRPGIHYRVRHVNQAMLAEIVKGLEERIRLEVEYTDSASALHDQKDGGEAKRLIRIAARQDFNFPKKLWSESGVETKPVVDLDTGLLPVVDRILMEPFEFGQSVRIGSKEIKVPVPEGLNWPEVLGILEPLGVGPAELERLSAVNRPTIAAALYEIERSTNLLLLPEFKARLAGLIYECVVFPDPKMEFTWADLMEGLDSAVNPKVADKPEGEPSKISLPASLERIAFPITEVPNGGLLLLIGRSFWRQVAKEHQDLNFGQDNGSDGQNQFVLIRDLISPFSSNQAISFRASLIAGQTGAEALPVIARHIDHLAASYLRQLMNEDRQVRFQACHKLLYSAGFECRCSKCQEAR